MLGLEGWIFENISWFWLLLCVAAILIELATSAALVSIWFAVGAFAAMLASMLDLALVGQWMVFAVVSLVTLLLFRHRATNAVNHNTVATNADRIIGRVGRVKEPICNEAETGSVVVSGQEWTARTKEDGEQLPAGSSVRVLEISGVKAIVEKEEILCR